MAIAKDHKAEPKKNELFFFKHFQTIKRKKLVSMNLADRSLFNGKKKKETIAKEIANSAILFFDLLLL
tara:strand:- start:154 stop:357 length:204 start_codon:yes stop_codon:yes gene_type:complete